MQLSLVGRNQRGDVSPCVIYTLFHVEKRIFIRVSLSLSLFPFFSSFKRVVRVIRSGFVSSKGADINERNERVK